MKNILKHSFLALGVSALLLSGSQFAAPSMVSANPCITLNYGGSTHWVVDKGTLTAGGKTWSPRLNVTVYEEDAYSVVSARKYVFQKNKSTGIWTYQYDSYTGKGSFKGSSGYQPVSGSQLANDILYIITN